MKTCTCLDGIMKNKKENPCHRSLNFVVQRIDMKNSLSVSAMWYLTSSYMKKSVFYILKVKLNCALSD